MEIPRPSSVIIVLLLASLARPKRGTSHKAPDVLVLEMPPEWEVPPRNGNRL